MLTVGRGGSNGDDRSSGRKGLGLGAWAVGDGESGLRRNCVGLVAFGLVRRVNSMGEERCIPWTTVVGAGQ